MRHTFVKHCSCKWQHWILLSHHLSFFGDLLYYARGQRRGWRNLARVPLHVCVEAERIVDAAVLVYSSR